MSVTRTVERTKYLYRKEQWLYFRMADGKLVPLPADTSSAEFARTYDACLRARKGVDKAPKQLATPARPASPLREGTVEGTVCRAIKAFKASPKWINDLRPSTRDIYDHALANMDDMIGDTLLADFADIDQIDAYAAEVAVTRWVKKNVRGTLKKVKQGGASTADLHTTLLSMIWKVCRKFPEFNIKGLPNPFHDVDRVYTKPKNPALPWTEAQQNQFVTTAPDHLVLGYLMLKFCGQRGGDAIKVKWTDFEQRRIAGEDGGDRLVWGILVAPEKGHDLEPEFLELPKVLVNAIRLAEKTKTAPTILTNAWGKPWSSSMSISQSIRLHLIKIGLAKKGTKTISMHGLRKNAAVMAADTDLGTAGVQSLTLHKSKAMADYYVQKRDRAKLRGKVISRINEMEDERADKQARARRAKLRSVK